MTPNVTVIITAYNQEHFIRAAVESVMRQTLPGWECIISDDGSTDSTLPLCQAAYADSPQIKVITQKNSGPAAARNHGVSHSSRSSRYMVFLDGDDMLAPDFLRVTVDYLERNRDVGLVTTLYDRVDLEGTFIAVGQRSRYAPGFLGLPRRLRDHEHESSFCTFYAATGQGPFSLYRREVFERTAGWETAFLPHEDTDMFCQMALKAPVHHLPLRLYWKRDHAESITRRVSEHKPVRMESFKNNAYELFRRKWLAMPPIDERESRLLRVAHRYYFGMHMPCRNTALALQTLLRSFPRYPEGKRWWIKALLRTSFNGFFQVWLLRRPPHADIAKIG